MKRDIGRKSLGKPSQRAKNITVSRKGGHGAESQRDGGDTEQGPCGVTVAEATAPSLQSLLPLLEEAENHYSGAAAQMPALWGPQNESLELSKMSVLNPQARLPLPVTERQERHRVKSPERHQVLGPVMVPVPPASLCDQYGKDAWPAQWVKEWKCKAGDHGEG